MTTMTKSRLGASSAATRGGPLELRAWIRLLECAKIIEKRLRRNFEEQFDTTLPRFDVLATLGRSDVGMRMGELSRALLVSNGNVTAVVRQLEDKGLVSIAPDPEDRRSAIVSLTPAGHDRFEELAAAHHSWVLDALSDFPEDKQRVLLDLLTELKTSLV